MVVHAFRTSLFREWRKHSSHTYRLRAFISSNTSSSFRVLWHSGKEDDDVVQLMDSNEDLMSEEEGAVLTSFANICHEPAFLQLGSTTPTGSNISEGLTAMEMKMLE
ncbi:hypothetical protein GCK32_021228 [Trichostrongylus colubriformis]|uniref:Uncharacterized protein n=1 Tax=Trichostrongylus colubriformis TaxID=6319 RepID=A0AAN8IQ55_TRICO